MRATPGAYPALICGRIAMGKITSFERICWHHVGGEFPKYPKAGQKVMLLFPDGSVVITQYDCFGNWCPRPLRWSRHPVGPDGGAEMTLVPEQIPEVT